MLIKITLAALIFVSTYLFSSKSITINEEPVIGIFTQPSTFAEYPSENYTYVAASYVKLLESGGARVIPIPYEADYSVLDEIFQNINGIVIPGGSTTLSGPSTYSKKVAYLVNKAMEINNNNGWFPIMGICLGHELLYYIFSNYNKNFRFSVYGQDAITKRLVNVSRTDSFYQFMKQSLFQATTTEQLAYYHHSYAISPSLYDAAPALKNILKITSTDFDTNSSLFITSSTGVNTPIYTFQYHPEKNPFEWTINANRSINANKFSRIHSYSFVDSCRNNMNKFTLQERLIYNFNPVIPLNKGYSQVYIFKRVSQMSETEALELKRMENQ